METILLGFIVVTFKLMICTVLYGMYRTIEKSQEYKNLIAATAWVVGDLGFCINVCQRRMWSAINAATDKGSKKVNYFQF